MKEREEELKKSRLINAKLLVHSTPIDPFFLLLLFRNEEKQVSILKVVRFGLNRAYFSKFYKVEESLILGNSSRLPRPLSFESLEAVARESIDAIEWGFRLIEPQPK